MKTKTVLVFLLLITSLFLPSCEYTGILHGTGTASLCISFDMEKLGAKIITYDFSKVATGTVFLKQSGVEKYSAAMTINTQDKSGVGTITDIQMGTYNVVVELYDISSDVLYRGTDTVSTIPGENDTKMVTLERYTANLLFTGGWTEEINEIDSAIVRIMQSGVVKYAGNLAVDPINKTIGGGVDNIYPDNYDVEIEITDSSDTVWFSGIQAFSLTHGAHQSEVSLYVKTSSVGIHLGDDEVPPSITGGPIVNTSAQDVTFEWNTDENATTNVCYSSTSGFTYQSSLDWAPVGKDPSADTTEHSLTIAGMNAGTYYYVVVSADASGNFLISDEGSFYVSYVGTLGQAGGYIFYDDAADGNDDIPDVSFLEAAPTEWDGLVWSYNTTTTIGTDTAIGTGASNTSAIVAALGSNGRAAYECDNLTVNSYNDWFLPSKDELNLMYHNLKQAELGGFVSEYYWSSSEKNSYSSWIQSFDNGFQYGYQKDNWQMVHVRAIRAY